MAFHGHCTAFVVLLCLCLVVDSKYAKDPRCKLHLPEKACPTKDEVFVRCVSQPRCTKTCADYIHRRTPNCHGSPSFYSPDCICKKGMLKNEDGLCVPERECECEDIYTCYGLMQMRR